jgi:hypothetical protein
MRCDLGTAEATIMSQRPPPAIPHRLICIRRSLAFMQACFKLLDGAYIRSWVFVDQRENDLLAWYLEGSWDVAILIQRYDCMYVDKTKA